MAEKNIRHEGIVEDVDDSGIRVKITETAACSDCHARGACSISEEKEKRLILPRNGSTYRSGEKVHVTLSQSLGFRALFIGYILPFVLVISVLLIMSGISDNELVTGLTSLGVLLPYYALLWLLKERIDLRFEFTLSKT